MVIVLSGDSILSFREANQCLPLDRSIRAEDNAHTVAKIHFRRESHPCPDILKKGCSVVAHAHESEQFRYVTSGSIRGRLPDKEITLKAGEVLCVPSNVEHGVVALEDAEDLEVFSSRRGDWVSGKDSCLRK